MYPTNPEKAMATSTSTKDNGPSMVKEIKDLSAKVIEEVEKKLSGNEQEKPDQESKSSAIAAYIDNVKKLLLSELPKEIEDFHNAKKLLSELQSKLQKEIKDIDNVKELLSELQKKIESLSTQLKDKPPHQPLLLGGELDPILENFEVSYDKLDHQLRICLLYLSIFPEKQVIKKGPIIYWWIANGLIKPTTGKTVAETGEDLFEKLLQLDLIMPCYNGEIPIVNKCKIHPWIRHMLIKFARKANLFDFDSRGMLGDEIAISGHACLQKGDDNSKKKKLQDPNLGKRYLKTIFNVGEKYLFLDPTCVAGSTKLVALQLGRWQESPLHHIEVGRDDFLSKALTTLKLLKYLSLRGISRITELPDSVLKLTELEILDLKACHNLETLPDDISALGKLTHLNVSGCYLLDGMSKGLGKLTFLEALKGFIIAESNRTPSRIGDLKSLDNLKRFSIHIGSEAEIQEGEFEKLEELKALKSLKISWGVVSKTKKGKVTSEDFKFPPSLEKLVLVGLPYSSFPTWLNPSKLKSLKQLYIKGGELNDLKHSEASEHGESSDHEWKVEILRLWYMKSEKITVSMARKWFHYLRYEPEIRHSKEAQEAKEVQEAKQTQKSEMVEKVEGS